jgi:hypothetical protein
VIRKWSEILDHYQALADKATAIAGIRDLVAHIVNSELALSLYAWTPMADLCIVQTEVRCPFDGPFLKVAPLVRGRIEFRYVDTGDMLKQWHREVESNEGIQRLYKFLEQLHWIASPSVLHRQPPA